MRRKKIQQVIYPIQSKKIPESFHGDRIVVLADLHNCIPGGDFQILLNQIRNVRPEGILIAGDLITEHKAGEEVAYEHAIELLTQLVTIAPVYYGLGNHEQRWKEKQVLRRYTFAEYISFVEELGVRVLENETVEWVHEDGKICVTGLALPNRYFRKKKLATLSAKEIKELVGEAQTEHFQILLAHTPQFFDAYMDWGADLALAGHYHGGVVRLPLIGGVISTSFRLFPKYDYGRWKRGNQELIVTSGLGCHTIPIRINNPVEFIVLELRGV